MSRTRTRATASLAALCLAAVPACGGSSEESGLSKGEYRNGVQAAFEGFTSTVQRSRGRVTPRSSEAVRDVALGDLKQALLDLATRLNRLAPPEGLQSRQDQLVAKARESAKDLDKVKATRRARDTAGNKAAQRELRKDIEAIDSAAQRLDAGSK